MSILKNSITGRVPGPELPAAHPRGHRLRPHLPRGRAEDHPPQPPDHPRPHPLQAHRAGGRVRAAGDLVQDAQPGDARAPR